MPRPAFIDIITEAKKSTYEEIESGFATDLANIYLEFKEKKKGRRLYRNGGCKDLEKSGLIALIVLIVYSMVVLLCWSHRYTQS